MYSHISHLKLGMEYKIGGSQALAHFSVGQFNFIVDHHYQVHADLASRLFGLKMRLIHVIDRSIIVYGES